MVSGKVAVGSRDTFRALREQEFRALDGVTYLNSASIGPIPERARAAMEAFNARRSAPHLLPDSEQFGVLTESRRLAAELLNVTPGEIALATNTSYGLNVAAQALPLARGDTVILSDREFPAIVYPWLQLRDRGVNVEIAPVTPEGWPDEAYLLERAAAPDVRVVAVSLVQFSSGYCVDLARLSAATRASGAWLVVDAIQGVGSVPVDLTQTPVDLLACGGQKWLLSPWGTGFVYVRRELITMLRPPLAGWMAFEGTDDFTHLTDYQTEFRADARRFELITLPYQDFAAFNVSLAMLLEAGIDRVAEHTRECQRPLLDLAARGRVRVTSPSGASGSAIICVSTADSVRDYARLGSAGVIASLREGSIRLSPHLFNTVDELAQVADLLARA